MLALWHDSQETRTTDLDHVARSYLHATSNEQITADQTAALPRPLASLLRGLVAEYEGRASLEADCARDADKLEILLQALEYRQGGTATCSRSSTLPSRRCGHRRGGGSRRQRSRSTRPPGADVRASGRPGPSGRTGTARSPPETTRAPCDQDAVGALWCWPRRWCSSDWTRYASARSNSTRPRASLPRLAMSRRCAQIRIIPGLTPRATAMAGPSRRTGTWCTS